MFEKDKKIKAKLLTWFGSHVSKKPVITASTSVVNLFVSATTKTTINHIWHLQNLVEVANVKVKESPLFSSFLFWSSEVA